MTGFNNKPRRPTIPASTTAWPPEDQRMRALRRIFNQADISDLAILLHCLGLQILPEIPHIAQELAKHIHVISFDTEHWSSDTRQMTEVGMANFNVEDILSVSPSNHGFHGEYLMGRVKFYLFRITENSHLPNLNQYSRGVEGNRFGQDRFVTFEQMRSILNSLFNQPIQGVSHLEGFKHPVVILGHAIGHDADNLLTKELRFNVKEHRSVLRFIDTQQIVRDAGYWTDPNHNISLRDLTSKLCFEHLDPHTACNDIAHTVIAAFQVALLKVNLAKKNCPKSMAQVVADLEVVSRNTYYDIGGSENYCWKCGSREHMQQICPNASGLSCTKCASQVSLVTDHIQDHCMSVAWDKAAEKRREDEERKKHQPPKKPWQMGPGNRSLRCVPPGGIISKTRVGDSLFGIGRKGLSDLQIDHSDSTGRSRGRGEPSSGNEASSGYCGK